MKIETFKLERIQSIWENRVRYNLTESGVHPYTLEELMSKKELQKITSLRLGYGQTNGAPRLRQAISSLYPGSSADNILVTNGSAEANLISVWSILDPGDEMVLMLPNYMQIWGLARSFGIKVIPFYLHPENSWSPDMDELRKQITSRTRVIAVCNPNNPTGAVLEESHMREIVRIADQAGAWIFADEIYRGAELTGDETPSFWGRYEKVLISGGLSKAYALPGLRLGWLVGPSRQIESAWGYHDYTSISSGLLSNHIAAYVLQPEKRKQILERNRRILRSNLDVLMNWVSDSAGIFNLTPPKAGGIAFLRYDLPLGSSTLTERIHQEKDVFIIAGDCFGMDGYIRIGIGAEETYFKKGLKLIGEFIDDLKAEFT